MNNILILTIIWVLQEKGVEILNKPLQDENHRMKQAFDHASLSMVTTDMEGRYLEVNQSFIDMTGFSRGELLGMSFQDITVSSLSTSDENMRRFRNGEIDVLCVEKQYKRKDGLILDVKVITRALHDQQGTPEFLFTQIHDLTEKKVAEKKLKRKRSELSHLIGNLQGIVYRCLLDSKWTMKYLSESCVRITGYEVEDLIDNRKISYGEIIHPDDYQRVSDIINDSVREGKGFLIEYRIIRSDRAIRWVLEQGSATRYDDNEPLSVEGYITDITLAMETEQRYRRFVENIPHGLAELTPDLRVQTMNKAFADMLAIQYPLDETADVFFPLDDVTEGLINRAMRNSETLYSEYSRDDKTFNLIVIPLSYNSVPTVQLLLQDITELRQVEKKLILEEARLRSFLNSLDLFAYVKDDHLRYTMVNKSFSRFLGLNEGEIIGKKHDELRTAMTMKDNLESDVMVIQDGNPSLNEFNMHDRVLKIRKFPLAMNEGRQGVGALISDITFRKRIEDSDNFLHFLLSHDLKNKLSVIMGYQELLKSITETKETGRFLEAIEKASQSGMELIDKVEVLKRLSSATEIHPVNLAGALKLVHAQFSQRLEDAKMSMQIDYEALNRMVKGGPLINELFSNLVENAILHSGGSRIIITGVDEGDTISCLVQDDGQGVEEADRNLLFQRGYRKGKAAGSGLGAYLAQRITEFYKADISAGISEFGGLKIEIRFQKET